MENTELMNELLKTQKKQLKTTRVLTFFAGLILAAVLVCSIVLLPNLYKTIKQANELIADVNISLESVDTLVADVDTLVIDNTEALTEALTSLNTLMDENSEGITEALENVNELMEANTDSVTEALENINKVDFEELNRAIKNLSDVIQPLADFFNRF